MLDSAFTTAAVIGAAVIASQFLLMLLGVGDDGDSGDGGHLGDAGHGGDAGHFGDAGHGGDAGHLGDAADAGDGVGDNDADWHKADADFSHPGAHWFYEMLSVRTIAAALLFFGLTGRASVASGLAPATSTIVALAAGFGSMYALFRIMRQVYRLQQSGNEDIRNAVGLDADVYLAIPPAGRGAGKIHLKMQDRLVEYQAVSDDPAGIPTGSRCVVTDVVGSDTVAVERD